MTHINRWAEEDLRDWTNNMEETFELENHSSGGGMDQGWDDDPRHTYVDDSDDPDDIDDNVEWDDFDEYDDDEEWEDEDDSEDEDENR